MAPFLGERKAARVAFGELTRVRKTEREHFQVKTVGELGDSFRASLEEWITHGQARNKFSTDEELAAQFHQQHKEEKGANDEMGIQKICVMDRTIARWENKAGVKKAAVESATVEDEDFQAAAKALQKKFDGRAGRHPIAMRQPASTAAGSSTDRPPAAQSRTVLETSPPQSPGRSSALVSEPRSVAVKVGKGKKDTDATMEEIMTYSLDAPLTGLAFMQWVKLLKVAVRAALAPLEGSKGHTFRM